MPEFGALLSLIEKLRIGVQQHTPTQVAVMLRNAKYTEFDAADIARLYAILIDLIREQHGEQGVAEFEAAYLNPPRKKRFGLF